MKALIFDCDGVLVDTEKKGHRVAFNQAFADAGLITHWDTDTYGELLKITGGKERMTHYFNETEWPDIAKDKSEFIVTLHEAKTRFFMDIIKTDALPYRPGVLRVIDEAIEQKMLLAICSTSNQNAVDTIVARFGGNRPGQFAEILTGDIVQHKKPSPDIYLLALEKLKVRPDECLVVEDSEIGLRAVKSAGMNCVITKSAYTQQEDFSQADIVLSELGDAPNQMIHLADMVQRIGNPKRH